MQVNSSETQPPKVEGFLQKSFKQLNDKVQKPLFWLVISIFLLMALTGYWIGSTMVVQPVGTEITFTNAVQDSGNKTYLLLELDDLSLPKPRLNSIWYVHLYPGDKPRLGFTPLVSIDMTENEDFKLLQQFSLDSNRLPTREFLHAVAKKGFSSQNYIMIDQISAASFLNWFAGKNFTDSVAIEKHTMTQYGQALRGLCSSLSLPSERGIIDFPWSKVFPNHFSTSLQFTQVMENIAFLTSPVPPRCEMVPLP
jgi:hypothetical protein